MNKNLKLVKSFYADETNLFSSLHRDVEWCETEGFPYGGTYRGVQALMDGVFSHIEKDWDGFRATPHTVLPSGADHVVTLGHYSGVFKKTGKTMKAAFAHVYTLRDGKVIRFQQFGDSALFRAAMG